jgi:PAS domain S-box-containing protein
LAPDPTLAKMSDEPFRILRWGTLWGSRLHGSPVPPWVVTLVALLSVGPSVAVLAGLDFGLGPAAAAGSEAGLASGLLVAPFVHVCLDWAAALTALILALFALFQAVIDRRSDLGATVTVWAFVCLLDAYHGGLEATLPRDTLDRPLDLAFSWLLSRLLLAVSLLVCGLLLGRRREAAAADPAEGGGSSAVFGAMVAGAALGLIATGLAVAGPASLHLEALAAPGAAVLRGGEAAALAVFAAAALWVLPRYHRARPSVFSHALLVSALPQVVAQLHMTFGARALYDTHYLLAHGQRLLGYLVVLGGFAFDYGRTRRSREAAAREYESAQLALTEKTREIERIDRERDLEVAERQRAERTLKMLEKAVETMSLGLTVTDAEGRIVYVNPAEARIHGYRVEELVGQPSRIFNAEGIRTPLPRPLEVVRWMRERLNVRSDGSTFPVRLVSDAVTDDEGGMLGVVTLCEDISEQRRIREAVERRDRVLQAVGLAAERFLAGAPWEERVGEVLEQLGLATGVDHVYVGNVQAGGAPGSGELVGSWTSPNSRLTPTTAGGGSAQPPPFFFEGWRKRLARGQTLRGRVDSLPRMERTPLLGRGVRSYAVVPIFVHAAWWGFLGLEDVDPEREWSRAELEALRTASQTLAAAVHRQQTAAALAASEERFREVLENANDLIQSVAADGRFQYVNRAWREALGYGEGEVARLTIADVLAADSLAAYREVVRRSMAGEEAGRVEATFLTRSGGQIPVEGSLNCRVAGGRLVAIRGIFRDISERKAIDRMKQEFLSTISHDLKTPLTSIIAALGLLEGTAAGPERTAELLGVANRNSNRLLRLINDLLDLQKVAAGKMTFRSDEVPVAPLLAEAAEGIAAFAQASGVELEIGEVAAGLGVRADRDRLMQVMNNLLSNAIKFSPQGGAVNLGAARSDGRVVLSVADRGPGIPEGFRHQLFDQFSQADVSASYRLGGAGLGLSIVKALVEGMKGGVSFESAEGEGTTFYVSLPAAG